MKKSLRVLAFVLVIATLALAGCGSTPPASSSAPASSAGSSAPASSQIDYPKGPITLIIPTTAGGGYDLGARLVAKYLPKYLPSKVEVVCENHSGGGQMIAVHYLYAAKNDGYTIGAFNGVAALLAQYTRGEEITFDMAKFNYLGMWQEDIRALGVSNQVTAKTWDELVAMCKNGPILAGTGGLGVGQHTDLLVLDAMSDLNFKYVHYDGSAQVEPAMGRNEIQLETAQTSSILSLEEQGMGRAFCVFSEERDPAAPDVPTALEVGMPKEQYDAVMALPFFGVQRVLACPPGTDPAIVEILQEAVWKVFQDAEYIAEVEKMGGTHNPVHGKELAEAIGKKIASVPNYPDLVEALKG